MDYVPVLVFVKFDFDLRFFLDIVTVNVHFSLEFALIGKLQKIVVTILQMDLVFASEHLRIRRFCYLQYILLCILSWICICSHRYLILRRFNIFSVSILLLSFPFPERVLERESTALCLLDN